MFQDDRTWPLNCFSRINTVQAIDILQSEFPRHAIKPTLYSIASIFSPIFAMFYLFSRSAEIFRSSGSLMALKRCNTMTNRPTLAPPPTSSSWGREFCDYPTLSRPWRRRHQQASCWRSRSMLGHGSQQHANQRQTQLLLPSSRSPGGSCGQSASSSMVVMAQEEQDSV